MSSQPSNIIDGSQIGDSQLAGIQRDVLIVGSGAAASAMASRLLDAGLRVLVLEAGGLEVDADISPYVDVPEKDGFGLSLQLGGATNLWSGRTAPLEDCDVNGEKGWPFERKDLDDAYASALDVLRLNPFSTLANVPAYAGASSQWGEFLDDGDVSLKRFQWSRPTFSGRSHFERLAAEHDRLTVVLNGRVLKLLIASDDPGRIAGVEAMIGERRVMLEAPAIAVCTGGLETPRLLMNSRVEAATPFDNDNIGRFFSTHPKANVGRLHLFRPVGVAHPLFSDYDDGKGEYRFGVGFSGEGLEVSGKLNHYVQFSPRFESIGLGLLAHAQQVAAPLESARGSVGRKFAAFLTAAGRVAFNLIGKAGLLGRKGTVIVVRGFFDQFPAAENRVRLVDEVDAFGMHKAKVDWTFSADDKASVLSFMTHLQKKLLEHQIGRLDINLPPADARWSITGIHSHFLGTTRMGASAQSSVVEASGRMHGFSNLYIGGAGLMTSYGNANPVLTIMALAIRTADEITHALNEKGSA